MLVYTQLSQTVEPKKDLSLPAQGQVVWYHLEEFRREEWNTLLDQLQIHPLARQAFEAFDRIPRVDIYKNSAYISTVTLEKDYAMMQIHMLAGENYVITKAEKDGLPLFRELTEDFQDHPEHLSHPGHVLYHILDKVSMHYLGVTDQMADEIQDLEKRVFKTPFSNEIGKTVYRWKGRLHQLRQYVEAQQNVIKTIGRSDFPFINEDAGFYFQDLQDNFSRVVSAFDTFKESLSSIFDLQMSLKSDHMNEIMKTLTLVSVVFIPMTFIAGLYGMNFEKMPELKWDFGYAYALLLMFGLGVGIALYFRKKGWWGDHKPE